MFDYYFWKEVFMSSPPLKHVWPSETARGSWEDLVRLSTSQPVHEESLPPIKYSCHGFAELWFTALQGLGCSLATFYPIVCVLGRNSVRKQEPIVWSQLWWDDLVSVEALPAQGWCEHTWLCNTSHCQHSSHCSEGGSAEVLGNCSLTLCYTMAVSSCRQDWRERPGEQ